MKLITIVWVTFASLSLLIFNASAGGTETRPQTTSGGQRVEAQLSNLQNRYDERLKTLEDNMSLLTQKMTTLVQTLTSTTNSADLKVPMQALTGAATHAIVAGDEAVKRMESFYTAMGTLLAIFIGGLTIVLTALGVIGGVLGVRQFKQAAQQLLSGELKYFKGQVAQLTSEYSDTKAVAAHLTEQLAEKARAVDILGKNIEAIEDNTKRNNEALVIASTAYMSVAYCILQLRPTTDAGANKSQLIASLAPAFDSLNNIMYKYKPTDDTILAWALTLRGTIFHLREEFESALRDFKKALEVSHERGPTLYNAACSACRLELKKEALSYLERALRLQPDRHAEAKADPDLKLVWDDI